MAAACRDLAGSVRACPIRHSTRLRYLRLSGVSLPDLSALLPFEKLLTSLEEVEISTMKSLRDVSSIAKVPALRFLGLWDCKALTPQSFECLIGHPTLKRVNFGVG